MRQIRPCIASFGATGEEPVLYGEAELTPDTIIHERSGAAPGLLGELCLAETAGQRERLIRDRLRATGFDWLGYGAMLHTPDGCVPRSFFHSYAHPAWSGRYFGERYYQIDPRRDDLPQTTLPMAWDIADLNRSLRTRGLTARGSRFIEDMLDSGIRSGLWISQPSPVNTGERIVISFLSGQAGRRWIEDDVFGRVVTLGLCLHEFLTHHARIALPEPVRPSVKRALSPMQQEILHCLVRGFSDKQIAYRLNLSSYNVDYHLRQLRRRFAVHNRVQLASAALGGGF